LAQKHIWQKCADSKKWGCFSKFLVCGTQESAERVMEQTKCRGCEESESPNVHCSSELGGCLIGGVGICLLSQTNKVSLCSCLPCWSLVAAVLVIVGSFWVTVTFAGQHTPSHKGCWQCFGRINQSGQSVCIARIIHVVLEVACPTSVSVVCSVQFQIKSIFESNQSNQSLRAVAKLSCHQIKSLSSRHHLSW